MQTRKSRGTENQREEQNSPLATGLGGSTGLTGESTGGGSKGPRNGRASELGDGGAEHLDGCVWWFGLVGLE